MVHNKISCFLVKRNSGGMFYADDRSRGRNQCTGFEGGRYCWKLDTSTPASLAVHGAGVFVVMRSRFAIDMQHVFMSVEPW